MFVGKAELIEILVRTGRAADIVLLLEGESTLSNDQSEGAPKDRELAKLWTMALYHLRFVATYGVDASALLQDGKWLSPFPDEFQAWLQAGAPGISSTDLSRYLEVRPL